MNINLISVNSKFIHKSLVPWYLKAQIENRYNSKIFVLEYTVNDSIDYVVEDIFLTDNKYLFFSCYIWNIEFILKIVENLKKVKENLKIFLGGPEVSFGIDKIFKKNEFIDFIIKGEGEIVFKDIVKLIDNKKNEFDKIKGVYSNTDKEFNDFAKVELDLDKVNSPYTHEMLSDTDNKIIYFESSRGCPFNCSYCLSSVEKHKIRYFSLNRVKMDIEKIIKSKTKQIKFVDRTFNCNKERFFSIINFINELETNVNFHFEISAILIDDEIIEFLKDIKAGRIQFEIGVQSTKIQTLKSVNRNIDIKKLLLNIKKIIDLKNIHVHVDLIAGLPYEDFFSFKSSFNKVYCLGANQLQLGFLKLLKGTNIRKNKDKFSYNFKNYPPYEVLSNEFINYNDIIKIKNIEELIDKYYNSQKFYYILKFIELNSFFDSNFDFYMDFIDYYRKNKIKNYKVSMINRYNFLLKFLYSEIDKKYHKLINNILKFDYLISNNTKYIPDFFQREYNKKIKNSCIKVLEERYDGDLDFEIYKKIIKKDFHFEVFDFNIMSNNKINLKLEDILIEKCIIGFDYSEKSLIDNRYRFFKMYKV